MARPTIVIGLIGGIGSGKSKVADAFGRKGLTIISGDRLGHEALRQPALRDALMQRWGTSLLDGTGQIDRRRLAALVFADP